MNAAELRIGNWVYRQSGKMVKEEVYNTTYKIQTINNQTGYKFQPIELTEEILLKCGFLKVRSDYEEAETFDFYYGVLYFDMANQSTKINNKYVLGFVPDYLHQLQNLYFALTGEELQVNL